MTKQQKQQQIANAYWGKAGKQEKELVNAVRRLNNCVLLEDTEANLAEINELVAYLNKALAEAKENK